jgi:hypothetical protein
MNAIPKREKEALQGKKINGDHLASLLRQKRAFRTTVRFSVGTAETLRETTNQEPN